MKKQENIIFKRYDLCLENPDNLQIIIRINKSVYQGARFEVNIQMSISF